MKCTTKYALRSLESELDGEQDPHGHRIIAAPRGVEAPAAHGLGGGLVEIGMSGGFLHEHVPHSAVDEDMDSQHGRALDAEAPRGGGIPRANLIAALRPRVLRDRAG